MSGFSIGSERDLLVTAFLAGEGHPRNALRRRDLVRRTALATGRHDPCIALLHHQRLALHGLADQTLGLFAHCLLAHAVLQNRRRSKRPRSSGLITDDNDTLHRGSKSGAWDPTSPLQNLRAIQSAAARSRWTERRRQART